MLPDDLKSTRPAGFSEKIRDQLDSLPDPCTAIRLTIGVRIRFVRPVDDERFPDNKRPGHKSPVPAVEAVIAIVPHGEILAFGDDDFTFLTIRLVPAFRALVGLVPRNAASKRGKFLTVCIGLHA